MANDTDKEKAEAERKRFEREAGKTAGSTATVTVACKLPNGLWLRVFEWEEFDEPMYGGGFKRNKRSIETGRYMVRGPAHPQQKAPTVALQSGYALTPGIPKEFWDKWLHDNRKTPMVEKGLIFAHENKQRVRDMAKDNKDVKTGLERIDPEKLPKKLLMADEIKESVEAGKAQTAALEEQD